MKQSIMGERLGKKIEKNEGPGVFKLKTTRSFERGPGGQKKKRVEFPRQKTGGGGTMRRIGGKEGNETTQPTS